MVTESARRRIFLPPSTAAPLVLCLLLLDTLPALLQHLNDWRHCQVTWGLFTLFGRRMETLIKSAFI